MNFRLEKKIRIGIWSSPDTLEYINMDIPLLIFTGKRNCIGELSARLSLFVGLTSLIQNFIFEADPVSGIPDTGIRSGFTSSPTPFKIRVKTRK